MMKRILCIILGMAVIVMLNGMAYARSKTFANGRGVSAKQSDGKSVAAMPDVCESPPAPPAGPVPIPYPNTGKSSDTAKGSKKVKTNGNPIMLKDNDFKKSTGDEAGTIDSFNSQQMHDRDDFMKRLEEDKNVDIFYEDAQDTMTPIE